jgi:hypothetical protein
LVIEIGMPSFAEAHASLLETGFETSTVEALERSTLPLTRSIWSRCE